MFTEPLPGNASQYFEYSEEYSSVSRGAALIFDTGDHMIPVGMVAVP
jgi:hypothetical protein